MIYQDFGIESESKQIKIKRMKQLQMAQSRVNKGGRSPKDLSIIFDSIYPSDKGYKENVKRHQDRIDYR